MVNGYIRIYTNGSNDLEGFKLDASIIGNFGFTKGITTVDLATPGQTTRVLFPTSGIVEDFDFQIDLIDDGTNKAFQINSSGVEVGLNKITIEEQVNFLLDNLFSADISAEQSVYIEYFDKEVIGILQIRGNISENEYFSTGRINANIKVGSNIFGLG